MTKYNFTTLPNRLTHHTYKWKETETDPEIIPAWIADMDFNVIPEVREAVIGYADQMVYGYTYASDSLYQSILDWEKKSMAIPLTRKRSSLSKVSCQLFQQPFKPSPRKGMLS